MSTALQRERDATTWSEREGGGEMAVTGQATGLIFKSRDTADADGSTIAQQRENAPK